jgi:glucokinase
MPNCRQTISVDRAQRPLFVGVDVGGTNTKIGLVDELGRTLAYCSIRTQEETGPADAVTRIGQAIRAMLAEVHLRLEQVAAVGLGTPGSMDIPKGMILEPPNMPHWRYFPLRDRLSEACGKPVSFANDANAAAYGEYWVGSGRDFNSMVMFTLGTGVGGGIILNGTLVEGENSFGSELGHMIIDQSEQARLCVWGGGRGQLEAYASAPAVVERAKDILAAGRTSSVQRRIDAGEQLTPLVLAEEAEQGDALALELVLETARHLAVGVVTAVHTVDPGAVILGGAMNFGGHQTSVGRQFLARVRSEFESQAYHVVAHNTTIDFASLGGDAGYIGAAGIARAAHGPSGG